MGPRPATSVTINAVSALERLPERLRRCVDQTIAAEALEGWRPTSEHVDALVALVNDEVTFGDYLAGYRARYPAQPTGETAPRLRRRGRPYLIPGTTLLRNNFGADTHATLADLEFVSAAGRIANWHRRLSGGDVGVDDLDVRSIHRQLFADVYAWAGSYRVTDLRLGEDVFARHSAVNQMMERLEETARGLAADDVEHPALADQLARLYADYNFVHPFREGNGRTGTLMLNIVATLRGRRLDLGALSRDEWNAASRDSMPSRRRGSADHRPFLPLFVRALD
jgi:cell filamentation protein